MSIKTTPEEIWQEYEKAMQYNESIGLYDTVKNNENFFLGRQWEGVNAPDLDKPVLNILKRVVNYFIAMLASDNIGVRLSLFNRVEDASARIMLDVVQTQVTQIMDHGRFSQAARQVLRDAAVDGDGVMHVFYGAQGRGDAPGLVRFEQLDNTAVFFGNPQVAEVQSQPYLILEYRRLLGDVKREMEENGRPAGEIDAVLADNALNQSRGEQENIYDDKATVLLKYWKENGTVWYAKTVRGATVKPPTDTGLSRYPICYMSWERVKNCYHGQSVISGLLPNQMAINKMAAMSLRFIRQQAFPRVFYDMGRLPEGWKEGIAPLGVNGKPNDIVYTDNHNTTMSGQVSEYIDKMVGLTKDLMGASDAALGNVRPDNTSAIISVQKATAVPLELVRQSYYQFVEDFVRSCVDQMQVYYGQRTVVGKDEAGSPQEIAFDFAGLSGYTLEFGVDIGAAAYWSEMTSIQSLDNLYAKQLVDPVTYLESIPSSALPSKSRIVKEAREKQEAAEQAAQQQSSGMPSQEEIAASLEEMIGPPPAGGAAL